MAMSPERRAAYWAAIIALFLIALWMLSPILTPFIFGAAIAYFLDPVADWFEARGFSRIAATALVTLIALLILLVFFVTVLPPLMRELDSFLDAVPGYIDDLRNFAGSILPGEIGLPGAEPGTAALAERNGEVSDNLKNTAKNLGIGALKGIVTGGSAALQALSVVFIAPVIAFYLLLDWDTMVARIDDWLPRDHVHEIRGIARDIDRVLSSFVRGQFTVCLILGTFYAVSLTLLGLNFGLFVGIFAGAICFVPFLGSFVGLILSTGIAVAQFWGDWMMIGIVAGVFIFGQLIEGNVLTPYLIGSSVGLHPVWLIFALSAFGFLFGFAGLLLAVPAAAAIGVIARWIITRYKNSAVYSGDRRDEDAIS